MRRPWRLSARAALALALFAGAILPAAALELTSGSVKLTLYEGRGRFALSAQSTPGTGAFVPLLSADDPRTSRLDIVMGNQIYTMGESPDFRETVEKAGAGARFTWTASFLQVTETFTFVPAAGASAASGVRIDLTMKNTSNKDAAVGARYILDTYLGEASFIHFRTPSLQEVTHELTLTPADRTPWWESPLLADPAGLGLQVMIAGDGVTPPDRVIFANWKRLTDSPWAFESSSVRNFSLLPYSVNDSAVAQYYDPRTLSPGAQSAISLVVGRFSPAGLTTAAPQVALSSTSSTGAVGTAAAAASQATPALQAVAADLASVDAILAEIDAALASGAPLTADRLAAVQNTLKDLGSRAPGTADAGNK